jgi:hypothetical protein
MAKMPIPARAEEDLINQMRETSVRQGWSLSTAMEIAMKRFIVAFKDLDLPNIGLDETSKEKTA